MTLQDTLIDFIVEHHTAVDIVIGAAGILAAAAVLVWAMLRSWEDGRRFEHEQIQAHIRATTRGQSSPASRPNVR